MFSKMLVSAPSVSNLAWGFELANLEQQETISWPFPSKNNNISPTKQRNMSDEEAAYPL